MTADAPHPLRSILFVPGSRPEMFAKAASSGADARVLDLEDAVPPAAKAAARANVSAELARSAGRLTFVRINHPAAGQLDDDLAVLAPHADQAVMVPKVDGPADIADIYRQLATLEQASGLQRYSIGIMVVVETTVGLRNLYETLATTPRARGAGLATAEEGDLMIDLCGQWTPGGEALAYTHGKFVCDARAAKAVWLVDGAFMNLRDDDALAAEATLGRVHGFNGKIAVHPRQVAVINRTFSPSEREVARAHRLSAAIQEAEAQGRAAASFEGMMIDYANVRRAQHTIALAQSVGSSGFQDQSPKHEAEG